MGCDAAEGDRQDRRIGPRGGASIFISGVDPGFANDLIPFAFAGTCQNVQQVRCMEIADYATYDGSTVMFDVMGFGLPMDQTPMLFLPGILGMAWGTTLAILAAGFGVTIDEVREHHESEPAPETFDIAAGTIEKGTRAAVRFEITGMVNGQPAIVIEHITRLRDDLRPGPRGPRRTVARTGWRSSVSRPTASTSAPPAASATTTTRRSSRASDVWSTPSPQLSMPHLACSRHWICR